MITKVLFGVVLTLCLWSITIIWGWLHLKSYPRRQSANLKHDIQELLYFLDKRTLQHRMRENELADGLEKIGISTEKCRIYRRFNISNLINEYNALSVSVDIMNDFPSYQELIQDILSCKNTNTPDADDIRWEQADFLANKIVALQEPILTKLDNISTTNDEDIKTILQNELCFFIESSGIHKLYTQYTDKYTDLDKALASSLRQIHPRIINSIKTHTQCNPINLQALSLAHNIGKALKPYANTITIYIVGERSLCDLLQNTQSLKNLQIYKSKYIDTMALEIELYHTMRIHPNDTKTILQYADSCNSVLLL